MCHGAAVRAFPPVTSGTPLAGDISGFSWGPEGSARRIAILPDIYGCTPFYRGLAAHFAENGARALLIDTFAEFGNLPEHTREAAFARRNKVHDKAFVDRFEAFVRGQGITGVIGFCLGGLYVFELARRAVPVNLIGLYGFPQGLPNEDKLPVPFDYLPGVMQPFTALFGREDGSVGPSNIAQLEAMAPKVPAMTLKIYEGVGHNFLPLVDSDDARERGIGEDALAICDRVLLEGAKAATS